MYIQVRSSGLQRCSIKVLGLGGGLLPTALSAEGFQALAALEGFPESQVSAVERDADVISIARCFFKLQAWPGAASTGWQAPVVQDDAQAFIATRLVSFVVHLLRTGLTAMMPSSWTSSKATARRCLASPGEGRIQGVKTFVSGPFTSFRH